MSEPQVALFIRIAPLKKKLLQETRLFGNGRVKALYAKVEDKNEYHAEGVYFWDTETINFTPYFAQVKAASVSTSLLGKYVCEASGGESETSHHQPRACSVEIGFLFGVRIHPGPNPARAEVSDVEERNTRTRFLTDEQYEKLAIECAKVGRTSAGLWLRTLTRSCCHLWLEAVGTPQPPCQSS